MKQLLGQKQGGLEGGEGCEVGQLTHAAWSEDSKLGNHPALRPHNFTPTPG